MKGIRLFYLLALFPPLAAVALTPLQKDRFRAELEVRRLEEKLALSSERDDLEPEDRQAEGKKLSALLTEAKIEKVGVLQEAAASRSPASVAPAESLAELFTAPKKRSAFDWQVLGELHGRKATDDLLRAAFGQAELPPAGGSGTVLWISSPSFPILSRAEAEKARAERAKAAKELARLGYKVEELAPSPFIHMEELTEDLQKTLRARLAAGPAFLLSQGSASAVLLRTFDNYPDLLRHEAVLGWLNLNGQLFAKPLSARAPASVRKESAADRQLRETRQEELRLRLERLEREVPLGAGFPVLNLVTLEGPSRPAENLRESIIPDGKTHFLKTGPGYRELGAALPALTRP